MCHVNSVCLDMAYPDCSLALIALRDVSKCSPLVPFLWFDFVCSCCAGENEILCFTSQGFINHSSALCFVTGAINATSWQRENQREKKEKEAESIISLSFNWGFVFFFHNYHIICTGIWKVDLRTSLTPLECKQACIVAVEEWPGEEGRDVK